MKRGPAAALLTALALALTACGDDSGDDSTSTERNESPSLAPSAEPTATPADEPTATAPSAPPPPPDATGPEEQPGGAGDEEVARTRVRLVIDGEGITPPSVEVPAFIALRVTVRNDLPRRIGVLLRGAHPRVSIRPRATRSFDVDGLQSRVYAVDAGSAGKSTIEAR